MADRNHVGSAIKENQHLDGGWRFLTEDVEVIASGRFLPMLLTCAGVGRWTPMSGNKSRCRTVSNVILWKFSH